MSNTKTARQRLTLAFPMEVRGPRYCDANNEHFAATEVDGRRLLAIGYTDKQAVARLKQEATELLVAGIDARDKGQTLIGCGDGTVILVNFRHGNWGFALFGGSVGGRRGGTVGMQSESEAIDSARRQANEVLGGILWEQEV